MSRRLRRQLVLIVAVLAASTHVAAATAGGQWAEEARLVAEDGHELQSLGISVDISGDTVLAGAPLHTHVGGEEEAGAGFVFTATEDGWEQTAELVASDPHEFDWFGIGVALDEDTAVLATDSPRQYVFSRTATGWVESATIFNLDAGRSVDLEGGVIVFGGWGEAFIYVRRGSSWAEIAKLTPSDVSDNTGFGSSVAISGGTVAVAAPRDGEGGERAGAVYVFTRTRAGWVETQKLTASDAAEFDDFGSSVAVFGKTLLVGAPGDDDDGSAYLFTKTRKGWMETGKLVPSDSDVSFRFGHGVALSADLAAIRASVGDVHVFEPTRSGWIETAKLTAGFGGPLGDHTVAISGRRIVAGAYAELTWIGAAYVFGPG